MGKQWKGKRKRNGAPSAPTAAAVTPHQAHPGLHHRRAGNRALACVRGAEGREDADQGVWEWNGEAGGAGEGELECGDDDWGGSGG